MTDLIQETLAKHAAVATGPGMDYRCSCEDRLPDFVYRYKEGHVAHQAEAVRQALQEVAANHPNPRCDKHSDDDPVTCGWKRAYTDMLDAIGDSGDAV